MESLIIPIVFFFFLLVSVIDIKYRAIPSVILTSLIFVVLILRPENLIFGVLALCFGVLIRDLIDEIAGMDFGVADIKAFVVIGLLISSLQYFFLMVGVFLVFQFVYTILWKWKVDAYEEMPFIPCIFAVYIVLMIVGGVA